jgi:hypothetical protein
MTRKIYKSAMGKTVDLGALLLQNEQVRAVGNMNINARGDVVDSNNRVIDQKSRQVQRQYRNQTNVSDIPVATGTVQARQTVADPIQDTFDDLPMDDTEIESVAVVQADSEATPTRGGLAGAIARSRAVRQELEKTPRQQAQQQPLRKI